MRLIAYIFLISILGFSAYWLYGHPSVISFDGFGYHITTSLNVALVAGITSLILLRFFYGIIRWLLFVPVRIQDAWKGYKSEKDHKNFIAFFLSAMNHDLASALKEAERIKSHYKNDPIFISIFGKVLLKSGHAADALRLFEMASHNPPLKSIGLSGLAYLKRNENDLLGEREALEELLGTDPQAIWVLRSLYENSKKSDDFKKAKETLSRLEDRGILTESQTKIEWASLYFLESQSYHLSDAEKEKRLRQAHFLTPESDEISIALAASLQKEGKMRQAMDVIMTTWHLKPSQKLGDAYLDLLGNISPIERYENLKKLTQKNPQDPESLLVLARYALIAQLWGEAKEPLLKLVQINPTAEAYQLLADLEIEGFHKKDLAYEWLKKALEVKT